jgi:uncharacterized RDD family membrane protein YckC
MRNLKKLPWLTLASICCLLAVPSLPAQDDPAPEPTPGATNQSVTLEDAPATNAAPEMTETVESSDEPTRKAHRDAMVLMGSDAVVKKGDTVEAVVVIGGNARIHGRVKDAVVVIGGNIEVDGEIGEAAVAVLGNIKALPGAKLGEVVTVGGRFDADEGVDFRGKPFEWGWGGLGDGLKSWFIHCVLKLRPLAPQVGWVWAIWGTFLLVYMLVALALQRPVEFCVGELARRPATTFLMGLLTKLLVPVIVFILLVTGVGVVVVPFVLAALFFGAIVGKVALLEAVGGGIGRRFGAGDRVQKPLLAFLVGVALLTILYMVPVIGLVAFGIVSVWGLGCAVTATFGSLRREMPEKPRPALQPAAPAMAGLGTSSGIGETMAAGSVPGVGPQSVPGANPPVGSLAIPLPDVLAYPKASFWERMGAAFLDLMLLGVLSGFVGRAPLSFLIALAYFAGMWTWKGTTIGGIVLGLKVVRHDGQPVSFVVALVRGLAAAFSAMVLFLGFLWIAWDKEKQGWHDKIAGTVVLKLPRGTPLVCF